MSKILYRTHTAAPPRGTLHESANGRLYKVTKVKQRGEVLVVYGTPATMADAAGDLRDELQELASLFVSSLPFIRDKGNT